MENTDHTTQSARRRSFAQEMEETLADWVKELPFIREVPTKPKRASRDQQSDDQLSLHRR